MTAMSILKWHHFNPGGWAESRDICADRAVADRDLLVVEGHAIVDRAGWTPLAEMNRQAAMSAWLQTVGIHCAPRFCGPGDGVGAWGRDYRLVRRTPFWKVWKHLCGERWEIRDNPEGNTLLEHVRRLQKAATRS